MENIKERIADVNDCFEVLIKKINTLSTDVVRGIGRENVSPEKDIRTYTHYCTMYSSLDTMYYTLRGMSEMIKEMSDAIKDKAKEKQ